MVDIEFIAQYLVLANAYQIGPELCKWSDNLRIFEACKDFGLLSVEEEQGLTDAYCKMRDAAHRLSLNKQTRIISADLFIQEREFVKKIWHMFLD